MPLGAARPGEQAQLLERIAARAGVALSAPATWLVARLGESPGVDPDDLARRYSLEPELLADALVELLRDWSPERHPDLSEFLRRVARDFAAQAPA